MYIHMYMYMYMCYMYMYMCYMYMYVHVVHVAVHVHAVYIHLAKQAEAFAARVGYELRKPRRPLRRCYRLGDTCREEVNIEVRVHDGIVAETSREELDA